MMGSNALIPIISAAGGVASTYNKDEMFCFPIHVEACAIIIIIMRFKLLKLFFLIASVIAFLETSALAQAILTHETVISGIGLTNWEIQLEEMLFQVKMEKKFFLPIKK